MRASSSPLNASWYILHAENDNCRVPATLAALLDRARGPVIGDSSVDYEQAAVRKCTERWQITVGSRSVNYPTLLTRR